MTQSWFGFIKVQLLFAWSNITTFAHVDYFRKKLAHQTLAEVLYNFPKKFPIWKKNLHFFLLDVSKCHLVSKDNISQKAMIIDARWLSVMIMVEKSRFFSASSKWKKRQWAEIIFRTGKPTVHNHHHHLWDAHTYPPLPIMQRAAACAPYSWPFNTTHQQGRSPHCISNKKLTSVWLKIYFPSNYYP